MTQEQTMAGTIGWVRGFSRYQWLVFLACWLEWTLDGTDFALFSFVLKPPVTTLVRVALGRETRHDALPR